jgi:DnaK suppressor protein
MAYSQEDLNYFKKILETKRAEALGELGELERSSRVQEDGSSDDRSTYSLHMADHGTDAMEREKSLLLAQRSSTYIDDIDEALQRIEDGTYGICRVTEKEISRARLEAVPTTTLSIEAKQQLQEAKDQP